MDEPRSTPSSPTTSDEDLITDVTEQPGQPDFIIILGGHPKPPKPSKPPETK